MRQTDIAWASGFFDGEGCIVIRSNRLHAITFSQKDPEPLSRLKKLFGLGHIYKCNQTYKGKSTYCHKYHIAGTDAIIILSLLLPYLIVKRNKAIEAIKTGEFIRPKARNSKFNLVKTKDISSTWSIEQLKEIIKLKNKGYTFASIGRLYNISKQRVHQLHVLALTRLELKKQNSLFP